jgi:DNA-binding response OmpR family regulator
VKDGIKSRQTALIIDDEPKIAALLKSYLEAAGYGAMCASNGREALALFGRHGGPRGEAPRISLILLDLMLPDISGEDFCKSVRQSSDVPIIMVTAKIDEESVIGGLNIGADDYVCKPFSPRQVVARVAAALRRSGGETDGTAETASKPQTGRALVSCGGLTVDTENRLVRLDGKPVDVTRDEYSILTLLMSRRAKIFTRDEILDAVKGDDFYGFDRSVDSHIKRLRAKLRDDPKSPKYISTVYGIGYRFGAGMTEA